MFASADANAVVRFASQNGFDRNCECFANDSRPERVLHMVVRRASAERPVCGEEVSANSPTRISRANFAVLSREGLGLGGDETQGESIFCAVLSHDEPLRVSRKNDFGDAATPYPSDLW